MTLEELSKQLKTTGLPVTYRDWPENEPVPDLPFICYLCVFNYRFNVIIFVQINNIVCIYFFDKAFY